MFTEMKEKKQYIDGVNNLDYWMTNLRALQETANHTSENGLANDC
jgi:hypothetical protein